MTRRSKCYFLIAVGYTLSPDTKWRTGIPQRSREHRRPPFYCALWVQAVQLVCVVKGDSTAQAKGCGGIAGGGCVVSIGSKAVTADKPQVLLLSVTELHPPPSQ